jgi:preprotein translocase subunit SecA
MRRRFLATRRNRRIILETIHSLRAQKRIATLDIEQLKVEASQLGRELRKGRLSRTLIAQTIALVDEALFRTYGFRFHDSQLQAGILLGAGCFVEMATGEGKTLTATIPVVWHALAGCSAHVVTVNDYLAQRDAEETRPIYAMLGLECAALTHDMDAEEKRGVYQTEIVYCANKDLVFDYLKDRIRFDDLSPLAYRVQLHASEKSPIVSNLDFVVIDEADSVLIDEANIPLILTEPRDNALSEMFVRQAIELAARAPDDVWELADKLGYRALKPERLRSLINTLPDPAPEWASLALAEELLVQAHTAQERYVRDVHYMIEETKIVLIDPQTGRPTPDRTLPWGLQQIIEFREGLEISKSRRVIAKQSFQGYFRKYHKMAGMSGTLKEVGGELRRIYEMPVIPVAPNKPVVRYVDQTHLFATSDQKIDWAINRIIELTQRDRPVLIGVTSVLLSEQVSAALERRALPHDVLNARYLKEEAEIVARAGEAGRITVVTNMAGRGTDIKLTPRTREAGGLHVVILDALETSRLERQLFGRAGRQGDPGSYDVAHALDEPELSRLIGKKLVALLRHSQPIAAGLTKLIYFRIVALRRKRLESVRRKKRIKVLKSKEKRDDLMAFTRRI